MISPMTFMDLKKAEYKAPLAELCNSLPDLLCDSNLGGSLEGLGEEDWSL